MKDIRDYFEKTDGVGILATADFSGQVNAAVYERPNVMDDETVAFIMPDHLTHKDLTSNPHASYLFMEAGGHANGVRLYLTRVKEEMDSESICKMLEQKHYSVPDIEKNNPLFLVFFHIDRTRKLVEDGERP